MRTHAFLTTRPRGASILSLGLTERGQGRHGSEHERAGRRDLPILKAFRGEVGSGVFWRPDRSDAGRGRS
jgi:hypothetical protein